MKNNTLLIDYQQALIEIENVNFFFHNMIIKNMIIETQLLLNVKMTEFDICAQGCNQQVIINEVTIIFQNFQIIFSLFHDFSSYAKCF